MEFGRESRIGEYSNGRFAPKFGQARCRAAAPLVAVRLCNSIRPAPSGKRPAIPVWADTILVHELIDRGRYDLHCGTPIRLRGFCGNPARGLARANRLSQPAFGEESDYGGARGQFSFPPPPRRLQIRLGRPFPARRRSDPLLARTKPHGAWLLANQTRRIGSRCFDLRRPALHHTDAVTKAARLFEIQIIRRLVHSALQILDSVGHYP